MPGARALSPYTHPRARRLYAHSESFGAVSAVSRFRFAAVRPPMVLWTGILGRSRSVSLWLGVCVVAVGVQRSVVHAVSPDWHAHLPPVCHHVVDTRLRTLKFGFGCRWAAHDMD